MVKNLEAALADDIRTLPWMTEPTRQQALIKLNAINNKIGYPDKWRDYSALDVTRGPMWTTCLPPLDSSSIAI